MEFSDLSDVIRSCLLSSPHESADMLSRTETIFHEVLAAPEEQRTVMLVRLCGEDTELLGELRSLLEACREEERVAARINAQSTVRAPQNVGPYQLDRLLGRGGMGAVYLAHRSDGQFEQQVAVKLIDLPLATEMFRERFRQERQILALLAHPYIARLLDGGVSENGDLYLAMEYVDGISIAKYCRNLSQADRLRLFQKVCGAVQFAHQNLVIHRDLKPDNILVVADGTPRLLDFGTAKLLSPSPLDGALELTRNGLQSYTPQYASPEQVFGHPITTTSDIYSLGVLLYLLLADVPPYVLKEFTTAEFLRVVCNEMPQKPSAVSIAVTKPNPDLDAIVLKALRKEPSERYQTVEQFSGDIQAYLDGLPVLARKGTLRYRAGKFVRRNKVALSVAALLLVSVLGGIAGVLWQAHNANIQRRHAEARSEDLRQLSSSLLSEIDEAVKQLPGSTPVQRLLVQRVLEHLDRMSKDASGERLTQLDLIDAYTRLGNLQGNPYDQNIGDPPGALISIDKAIAIAGRLKMQNPRNADVFGPLALAQQSRSEILFGLGRTQESLISMRSAVAAFDEQIASGNPTAAQLAEAASAYGALGDQLGQTGTASLGDTAGALAAYQRGLEISRKAAVLDPNFLRARRAVAIDLLKIGNMDVQTDPAKAIVEYRASIAAWEALPPADKATTATRRGEMLTYGKLGLALDEALEFDTAIEPSENAVRANEYFAKLDPTDTRAQADVAVALTNEALIYVDMLDPKLSSRRDRDVEIRRRAMELLRRAGAAYEALNHIDPANTAWAADLADNRTTLGTLEQQAGLPGGEQRASTGIQTLRELTKANDASIHLLEQTASNLLDVLPAKLQDSGLAASLAQRAVDLTHRKKVECLLTLAQANHAAGHLQAAREVALEALALLPPVPQGAVETRQRRLLRVAMTG